MTDCFRGGIDFTIMHDNDAACLPALVGLVISGAPVHAQREMWHEARLSYGVKTYVLYEY